VVIFFQNAAMSHEPDVGVGSGDILALFNFRWLSFMIGRLTDGDSKLVLSRRNTVSGNANYQKKGSQCERGMCFVEHLTAECERRKIKDAQRIVFRLRLGLRLDISKVK
jgi:hypothetical protein